jgi:hypothetical protein
MSLFKNNDDVLDRAIAEANGEPVDPAVVEQAAARVWDRLSHGEVAVTASSPAVQPEAVHLRGCDDYQALIPAYLRGELAPARALLVEDHTRTCVPCRRALREAREGHKAAAARPVASPISAVAARRAKVMTWTLAAALVIGLGLGLIFALQEMMAGGSRMARVESIQGSLYLVADASLRPLGAGDMLDEGQEIRTAKGSTALVRMTDGSLIEISDRARLSLDAGRKGNTIRLDGGRIIVQAAKQRNRHLFVATPDSLVSVTGTIFSVNSGTKGSRVSVIEGEVRVHQTRRDDILHPGDQVTTHASVSAIPIRAEVAWSRNAAKYDQLLAELTAAGKDIDARVARPGLRTSTRLLDLAPADTRAWIALPNLAANLNETQQALDEKIAQSPTLKEWWSQTLGSPEKEARFRETLQKLGDLGHYLGEEVAVAIAHDQPVIYAEVTNEAGFRAVLEQEAAELSAKHGGKTILTLVDSPDNLPSGEHDGLYGWVGDGLFIASPDGARLGQMAAIAHGGANAFTTSTFHDRIAQEYNDGGAGWLFAADLAGFISEEKAKKAGVSAGSDDDKAEALGLHDVQHLVIDRREVEGRADTRAALTFSQQRRGLASWLAAPAPMGSLSFISPDANLAAAFVVKQPVSLLDDLLATCPELATELAKLKAERGIDVREDLAAPLGGEVALAVDGPLLPTPSWKLVAEVYDPVRLQSTIDRLVTQLDAELRKNGKQGLHVEKDEQGDRTYYTIRSTDLKLELHYTFSDGYLVATPTRALLDRALQQRESGVNLASNAKFRDLLGQDGQVNVSGFVYQNLAPVLDAASKLAPSTKGDHGQEGPGGMLRNLIMGQGPTLIYAYAEGDRILFASSNQSPLGLNLQTLAGFGGVLGMMNEAHGDAVRAEESR